MLRTVGYSAIPVAALYSRKSMCEHGQEEADRKKKDTARFVHATVVFRHGARPTVFTSLPGLSDINWNICTKAANDSLPSVHVKHMNGGDRPEYGGGIKSQMDCKLKGGCFAGQLSDLGINQTEALGKTIKSLYGGYIGDDLSKVTVRSTNVPRTIASAQGVLKGMFPQNQFKVPIYTLANKEEYAIPSTGTCPRLAEMWKASTAVWHENPEGDGVHTMKELKNVIPAAELKAYKLDAGNFIPLRDLMIALDAHGLPYPTSIEKLSPLLSRIDRLGGLQIGALLKGGGGWANEVQSSRLSIGKLLNEIMERLSDKASKQASTDPSLYLVSAHDTTLVPLLVALGVYDGNWPPFASYISFELWETSSDQFMVRVLFNGKAMPLPRCQEDEFGRVPLTAALKGLKPVMTKNLQHECRVVKKPLVESNHELKHGGGDKF